MNKTQQAAAETCFAALMKSIPYEGRLLNTRKKAFMASIKLLCADLDAQEEAEQEVESEPEVKPKKKRATTKSKKTDAQEDGEITVTKKAPKVNITKMARRKVTISVPDGDKKKSTKKSTSRK